ncbi:hypothetical protein ACOMHN_017287 [Nucella lapillus]
MENVSESDFTIKANTTHISEFTEYQVALILWKVYTPCVLLLGSFGNVATFFVMRRIKDHNSSQHAILMALAVSDFSLLYSDALRVWVYYLFHVDVRQVHPALCKIQLWVIYSVNTTSAWMVTSVTVQRTMAVLWPHRMRVLCTVRRTWIVVATLVTAAFLLNAHLALGFDFLEDGVLRSARAISSKMSAGVVISSAGTMHNTDSRRKTTSRTTVLVLALSCAFLLFTMPVCTCLVWYGYVHPFLVTNPQLEAKKELAYAVTFQLWYTNSAVNFLLYCFTGTKFRREFMNWIRCSCGAKRRPAPQSVREDISGTITGAISNVKET